MNITGTITAKINPTAQVISDHGLSPDGDVQKQFTRIINQRITRYMPFRSGALATKLKFIKSPTEIEVLGPYARVTYYGKIMIDPVLNAAGFLTDNGWRSRKGVPKVVSTRPINYNLSKNPLAGPFWDRRMIAAEGDAANAEIQDYVDRGPANDGA